MSSDIKTTSGGFNWGLFLLVTAAALAALFLFNTFSQQKLYNSQGQEMGSTKTRGKMPKMKGGKSANMRKVA